MHFLSCAGELNHHGRFMCDSMYHILGSDFKRITTQQVNEERLNLGYQQNAVTEYNTVQINADKKTIEETIRWCDVIDFGAAPEGYLAEAVKQNKIVFIRIERLFKEGTWKLLVPQVLLRYYRKYIRYRKNPNVYFLCVSGYAAKDLARIGIKGRRVLQWAYCPKFIPLDETTLQFRNEELQILWCGRMIGWKHPEIAVKIAEQLKNSGYQFHMKMIGTGDKFDEISKLVKEKNLESEVEMLGAVEASKVRDYMKEADVFLATSDQNEGWGVVINEAMNSGCAVFATKEMGAVPVLIEDGVNGFYITPDKECDAVEKIIALGNDTERMQDIKIAAYETIKNQYSPDVYATRFIDLANNAMDGKQGNYKYLGAVAIIR